jgi:hypothetical protein
MDACLNCEVREEARGRWSVARNGMVVKSDFRSERDAALAATAMVREAGRDGYNATATIVGAADRDSRSWSYGEAPVD